MATVRLTTRKEMENLFSIMGIDLRLDEMPNCKAVLDFFILDASSQVGLYIGQRYTLTDLSTNDFVRSITTWIACYRLSARKGNPTLFAGRYQEILEQLEQIKNGELPLDAATRWDMVPTLSNIEHDPRFRDRTSRVDQETSTGLGGTRPQELSDVMLPSVWEG